MTFISSWKKELGRLHLNRCANTLNHQLKTDTDIYTELPYCVSAIFPENNKINSTTWSLILNDVTIPAHIKIFLCFILKQSMSSPQKHHKFQSLLQNIHTGCLLKIISPKLKTTDFLAKKLNVLSKKKKKSQLLSRVHILFIYDGYEKKKNKKHHNILFMIHLSLKLTVLLTVHVFNVEVIYDVF